MGPGGDEEGVERGLVEEGRLEAEGDGWEGPPAADAPREGNTAAVIAMNDRQDEMQRQSGNSRTANRAAHTPLTSRRRGAMTAQTWQKDRVRQVGCGW